MYKVELVKKVKSDREKKGDEAIMTLLTPREKVARSGRRRPRTAPAHVLTPTELGYDEERGKLFYNVSLQKASLCHEVVCCYKIFHAVRIL